MANRQIGDGPVERRTVSINRKDWNSLSELIRPKHYDLNGISSLCRLFLRTWQKFNSTPLNQLSAELIVEGYEPTLHGLLRKVRDDNDRIQPELKKEGIGKNSISGIVTKAFGDDEN